MPIGVGTGMAIMGGATLIGGAIGAGGASKAAGQSAEAAKIAAYVNWVQSQQTRNDLAPYREVATGTQNPDGSWTGGALNQLADFGRSQVDLSLIPESNIPDYDPSGFNLFKDPSYQFRLNEQNRQINRNMAGMGKLTSGNRLEEIMKRSGEMASQEYAAADARNVRDYGIDRGNEATIYGRGVDSYGRAYGAEGDYLNRLASLSNIGQTATTNTGQFGAASAANQGNALISAGNAQGAGSIGQASAWQKGLGDLTSLVTDYYKNRTPYADGWVSNDPSVWG